MTSMPHESIMTVMGKKPKARMGRPPKPRSERRGGYRVNVNLTQQEKRQLEREARAAGLSLSEFLLRCWQRVKGD